MILKREVRKSWKQIVIKVVQVVIASGAKGRNLLAESKGGGKTEERCEPV